MSDIFLEHKMESLADTSGFNSFHPGIPLFLKIETCSLLRNWNYA